MELAVLGEFPRRQRSGLINHFWVRAGRDFWMVVALIDGESCTLKRIHPEGNQVRLQPANPEVEPIVLDAGRVQVQGVVVGLLRRYR